MKPSLARSPIRIIVALILVIGLFAAAWFTWRAKPTSAVADSAQSGAWQPQVGDFWLASAVPLSQGRAAGRTRYLLFRVDAIDADVIKVAMHKNQFDEAPQGDWQAMGLNPTDFETSFQFQFARRDLASQLLVQNDRDRVLRRLLMTKRGNAVTVLPVPLR